MQSLRPTLRQLPAMLVLAIAASLAGCDKAPPPPEAAVSPGDQAGARRSVGLVMKTLTNPFFVEMEKGARKAETEFDIDLVVKTAAQETSIEQQIGIVDELIREKVDAIVIAPGDSIELIPVLRKAQGAGITVVNIDNRLDPDFSRKSNLRDVPFISVDNKAAAYRSAKYIADQVHEPSKAVLMEGIRSAMNAKLRMQGAMQAFAENPDVELVEVASANWKIDEADRLMTRWLEHYPDVKLVFAANDMMALGVVNALQAAGRGDVLVASFDALREARKAVEKGTLQATVDQLPAQQGYLGVQYAVRMMDGESLPATTLIDTVLITRENVAGN